VTIYDSRCELPAPGRKWQYVDETPSAGDLLIAAVDLWAQHVWKDECVVGPDGEECNQCLVRINQLRLAYKVWQNSAHQAAAKAMRRRE
jgi:hypothetical protein